MRRIVAKTALLAVLAAGKDPPIPPWMRAILDSRPNFRGSVHRSQYPEDLELKAAGAQLAKPPIRNPVVVAMTTTPTRAAACEPAVRSLLNQSQPALIIVSIPDARGDVLLSNPSSKLLLFVFFAIGVVIATAPSKSSSFVVVVVIVAVASKLSFPPPHNPNPLDGS